MQLIQTIPSHSLISGASSGAYDESAASSSAALSGAYSAEARRVVEAMWNCGMRRKMPHTAKRVEMPQKSAPIAKMQIRSPSKKAHEACKLC